MCLARLRWYPVLPCAAPIRRPGELPDPAVIHHRLDTQARGKLRSPQPARLLPLHQHADEGPSGLVEEQAMFGPQRPVVTQEPRLDIKRGHQPSPAVSALPTTGTAAPGW